MYGLLTKSEVKMEGYWTRSFSCVLLAKKKRKEGSHSSCQTSLVIRNLSYGLKNISFEKLRVISSAI